jgi:hypothetical protein
MHIGYGSPFNHHVQIVAISAIRYTAILYAILDLNGVFVPGFFVAFVRLSVGTCELVTGRHR